LVLACASHPYMSFLLQSNARRTDGKAYSMGYAILRRRLEPVGGLLLAAQLHEVDGQADFIQHLGSSDHALDWRYHRMPSIRRRGKASRRSYHVCLFHSASSSMGSIDKWESQHLHGARYEGKNSLPSGVEKTSKSRLPAGRLEGDCHLVVCFLVRFRDLGEPSFLDWC